MNKNYRGVPTFAWTYLLCFFVSLYVSILKDPFGYYAVRAGFMCVEALVLYLIGILVFYDDKNNHDLFHGRIAPRGMGACICLLSLRSIARSAASAPLSICLMRS